MDETSDENAGARFEDTGAASNRVQWGRVVAGIVVAVIGMLALLAAIPLFIFALTATEICIWACNPVSAGLRVIVGLVGVLLLTVGLAWLNGASRLLFRKPLVRLVAWWVPDPD